MRIRLFHVVAVVLFIVVGCSLAPQPQLTALQKAETQYAQVALAYEATMLSLQDARSAGYVNDAQWQRIATIQTQVQRYQPVYRASLDLWKTLGSEPTEYADIARKVFDLLASLKSIAAEVKR